MEQLCTKAIKRLLQITNISEDEDQIEVYVYGLLSYVYTFLPLAILLIISFALNRVVEMLLWALYFVSLRKYAGGYHASYPLTCFLCSTILGISSLVLTYFKINISLLGYICITIFALIYFVIFSPITKKEFCQSVRYSCKIRLCIILLISLCIFSIHLHLDSPT